MFCVYCAQEIESCDAATCSHCGRGIFKPRISIVNSALSTPAPTPMHGKNRTPHSVSKNFNDEYQEFEELGCGGMAVVYRGVQKSTNKVVAIKKISGHAAHDAELQQRFMIEARTLASLDHPNIIKVFRYYDQPELRIVMEYVDNGTVESFLQRQGALPQRVVAAILHGLLDVLDYCANRTNPSVVHRDIKPSNIMLTKDFKPKLMDFGIALAFGGQRLTNGGVIGSLAYMSPEQIRGETPDSRTDQFSLGVTAYEMLTGRQPLSARVQYDLQSKIITEVPSVPTSVNRELDPAWDAILMTMMEKNPSRRYQVLAEAKNQVSRLM